MTTQELERRDVLRRTVRADRVQLQRSVTQLGTLMRRRVDVTRPIIQRPWHWLGGAFAVGLCIGLGTPRT